MKNTYLNDKAFYVSDGYVLKMYCMLVLGKSYVVVCALPQIVV